jgi:carbamate kinase
MSVSEAKRYLAEGHFPAGSMGPKIEAAIQFLECGGKEVIITQPETIIEAVESRTGTHIYPG